MRATGAAVAGCVALLLPSAGQAAGDPALETLRAGDVYVSARLGLPADTTPRLAAVVAELASTRGPVKIVITHGAVGTPSAVAYARRLRARLGFRGTLVVSGPGRRIAVVAPRPAAETTRALRAARVGRIADPVDRAVAAARAAVPPLPSRGGWRGALLILGLGLVGGLWAAAIGLRRVHSQRHHALERGRRVVDDALNELGLRSRPSATHDAFAADTRVGLVRATSIAEIAPLAAVVRDALVRTGPPPPQGERLLSELAALSEAGPAAVRRD